MGPFLVIPVDPVPNDPPRLLKGLERVLPDALLFQTPKKPFDHPVLLWRVGRDELLLETIVATGLPESLTLKDQVVVAPEDRRPHGPQRPKPRKTGRFHRALGLLRATPQGELVTDQFAVMEAE